MWTPIICQHKKMRENKDTRKVRYTDKCVCTTGHSLKSVGVHKFVLDWLVVGELRKAVWKLSGAEDVQLMHAELKRRPFHAKARSGAVWSADYPIGLL